jgi:hypothetical protein
MHRTDNLGTYCEDGQGLSRPVMGLLNLRPRNVSVRAIQRRVCKAEKMLTTEDLEKK